MVLIRSMYMPEMKPAIWAEESVTYTIDITAPTITHDGPADTIDLTNGNQTLFSITDANGVTEALYAWDSDANQTLNSPFDITLPA